MVTPDPLSIVVKGRVLQGHELEAYAERRGLCTICGLYQTHHKVGTIFSSRLEPMTVADGRGVITVYKGYCVQPTCYTSVEQVKELLGDSPTPKKVRKRRSDKRASSPIRARRSR
jgi:hypothetical protein